MTIQLLFLTFDVYQNHRKETSCLIFIFHEYTYLLKHATLNLKLLYITKILLELYIKNLVEDLTSENEDND